MTSLEYNSIEQKSSQMESDDTSNLESESEEGTLEPTELGHFHIHFPSPPQFWKPFLCKQDFTDPERAVEYITENFHLNKIIDNLWVFPHLVLDYFYKYTYVKSHYYPALESRINKFYNAYQ